jgi:hypothetical protein
MRIKREINQHSCAMIGATKMNIQNVQSRLASMFGANL